MSQPFPRRLCLALPLPFLLGCGTLTPRSEGPPPQAAAPPFTLLAQDGKRYALTDLIRRGPALVVFYRGFW